VAAVDPVQRKRDQVAARQRKRRALAKAACAPIPHTGPSGPSGKSGGKATQAVRAKRYRDKKKDNPSEDKS